MTDGSDPTARALRLLSLLQARRTWGGAELADRLGISARTLRRDVDRLRELDYPVHADRGPGGGYRLEAGAAMPPLALDDDEAVAVAVGLRGAAGGGVGGIDEASLRALAKLEQVLPTRLRSQVAAVASHTTPIGPSAPLVGLDVLTALAQACRDGERVRFAYRRRDGETGERLVEPHGLVPSGRRWYLTAWDVDRAEWRTFRADRLADLRRTGERVPRRELPGGDAALVHRSVRAVIGRHRAVVTLHAPRPLVLDRLGPMPPDLVVDEVDAGTCRLVSHADSVQWLAFTLGQLDVDLTVHEPPELVDHVAGLVRRWTAAIAPARSGGAAASSGAAGGPTPPTAPEI